MIPINTVTREEYWYTNDSDTCKLIAPQLFINEDNILRRPLRLFSACFGVYPVSQPKPDTVFRLVTASFNQYTKITPPRITMWVMEKVHK